MPTNVKHAYLIMCHCNFEQLVLLLKLLDSFNNDIYIHIDKKAKNVPFETIKNAVHKSQLNFVKRINVNWGGHSQIKAEMILLKAATKTYHCYYHLISGLDLPIKSQEEILNFFETNSEREFISVDSDYDELLKTNDINRVKYYHFCQNIVGRNKGFVYTVLGKTNSALLKIQKMLKINRLKNVKMSFYKGANWFSITHGLAVYVLKKEKEIQKHFRFTHCADELFLQTIAMNSPFASKITNDNLRYIDWNRGGPYTFEENDFDELIKSDKLFARKFDEKKDFEIIKKIYSYLV